MFKELYDALPPYGQVLLTVGVVLVGVIGAWKGFVESKKIRAPEGVVIDPHGIPSWALYGPVHEAIQTIHDMAEENRTRNTLLRDIIRIVSRINEGQEYTHDLLEEVIRNQHSENTMAHPPVRRTRRQTPPTQGDPI